MSKTWLPSVTRGLTIALIATVAPAQMQSAFQSSAIPLQIQEVNYDPNARTVRFALHNPTDRVVTAWMVDAYTWMPSGSIRPLSGFGTDSYLSAAGVLDKGSHIGANQTIAHVMSVSKPSNEPVSVVEVRVTAVIFDDGSSAGNEKLIDGLFQNRDRDRQTWEEFLGIVSSAVGRNGRSLAALRVAREEFDSPIQSDQQSAVRRMALNNLRLAVEAVTAGVDSADSRLSAMQASAQRRLDAARAHARRR